MGRAARGFVLHGVHADVRVLPYRGRAARRVTRGTWECRTTSSRRPGQPPKRLGQPPRSGRHAGRRGCLIVPGGLGAADVPRRRVQATEGGQRFAHVLRKMSPGAAVQQVSSAASGSGHLRAAALSPAPHFRLRCSRPISERRRRLAGQLDGMTRARMCSGGVEQPPLALSIESGAADALCLAAPCVRRYSPPPLLILCGQAFGARQNPARIDTSQNIVMWWIQGGGEAIHTAAMRVTYPLYGCPDQPPEIRDRSRCAALGQRPDAVERPDVQNAPVRTTTKMCRLPQSLT